MWDPRDYNCRETIPQSRHTTTRRVTLAAQEVSRGFSAGNILQGIGSDMASPLKDDNERLRELGYKPEFKRQFSLLSLASFGYLTLTPASAITLTLVAPLNSGGPQAMFWGWILVSIFTIPVAMSMAEVASVWPTSGGPSTWSYKLCPSARWAPFMSYLTSYLNLAGQFAFTASAVFQSVFQILGFAVLTHETYTPKNWHYVLVSIAILFLFAVFNIVGGSTLINKATTPLLWYNILGTVGFLIALLVTTSEKTDASFVFTGYINNTGWGSHGLVFILGLLQSAFTMVGYESCVHLSEEMQNPGRGVPLAMMITVVIGTIAGLLTIIPLLFCLGDLESLLGTATGSPFLQLAYNSTGSKAGAIVIAFLPTSCALIAAITMLLANSRTLYAISRDGGFIAPKFFQRLSPLGGGVPVNAIILCAIVESIILVLYLGNSVLFFTVISLATIGFELTYLIPILFLVLGGRKRLDPDRSFKLPEPVGKAVNLISVIWLTFVSITVLIPAVSPVTASTMNYTIAMLAFVIAFASILWLLDTRKRFQVPDEVHKDAVLYGLGNTISAEQPTSFDNKGTEAQVRSRQEWE